MTISFKGFLPLLTLLFIGLRLGHIIDWSWFWVLSPILAPVMILSLGGVAAILLGGKPRPRRRP